MKSIILPTISGHHYFQILQIRTQKHQQKVRSKSSIVIEKQLLGYLHSLICSNVDSIDQMLISGDCYLIFIMTKMFTHKFNMECFDEYISGLQSRSDS